MNAVAKLLKTATQADDTLPCTTQEDVVWKAPFGILGALDTEGACEFLGGVSHDTLERLAASGVIRRRVIAKKARYCKRSLQIWLARQPDHQGGKLRPLSAVLPD
jgi:hypothetical protein